MEFAAAQAVLDLLHQGLEHAEVLRGVPALAHRVGGALGPADVDAGVQGLDRPLDSAGLGE
ncbi:hypothetical protein AB0428_30965 [Streptomyces virginiae]|uniref:hypothetical protein n=1 Tax=Streptomyces virginiae TaxID=1961 RepID=UPI00344DF517